MNYRAELQVLLDDETLDVETWLYSYPIEEGPFLILEYKNFMQKWAIENDDFQTVEELQCLDNLAEKMQNFAIDKLAERQEKQNRVKVLKEKIEFLKQEILKNDLKEVQVSEKVLEELREIVEYLKSNDMYDEELWGRLQDLL